MPAPQPETIQALLATLTEQASLARTHREYIEESKLLVNIGLIQLATEGKLKNLLDTLLEYEHDLKVRAVADAEQ